MTTDSVLLIRAVDASATYLSFRWLDDPANPEVHTVTGPGLRHTLSRLDAALIGPADDTSPSSPSLRSPADAAVRAALTGPFTRPISEYALAEVLTRTILPETVRRQLLARATRGTVRVRITPSRALARVPFELLLVGDHQRLIEVADISYDPPSAIHLRRGRLPEPWTAQMRARPVVYAVEPLLPGGSGLRSILGRGARATPNRRVFAHHVAAQPHTEYSSVTSTFTRHDLSDDLSTGPGRLFYFGHVSSTLDQPGSAALHFSDDDQEWGLAAPLHHAHRPLSALDLLVGTVAPELGPGDTEPERPGIPGHELWPMPPRVAIIACEGGADYRSSEAFGLVMAILNAGAEVLTTTRWTLPSDEAFRQICDVETVPGPTTELALAVDASHTADDPVAALARWQRRKLAQWRSDPGAATSPLTWAALGCHVCPPRKVQAPDAR
ncbi:MAG: CHAT domain-containing protein [Gordonia sp. (in: high G+C Gram-positive bacteria)]